MKNRIGMLALLVYMHAHASIADNRFIPWYQQSVIRDYNSGCLKTNLFFLTADSAYGNEAVKHRGIPELYGTFDQIKLGLAAQAVGKVDPLNPIWQIGDKIEWNVHGKLQGQGVAFNYQQNLGKYITVGINTNFLHLASSQKFVLPARTISDMGISPAQQIELDQQRRTLLQTLGLSDTHWSDTGFSDTFLFVRLGGSSEYKHKCRYLSGGTTFGFIAPSSKQRDVNYASSIPFGGENLSGFSWGLDVQAEMKEDFWVGSFFELIQRFSKTQTRRLPVKGEPEIFGALIQDVHIRPGVTVAFSPFVRLDHLRDGWYFHAQYVYQFHAHDTWTDKRIDTTISVNFADAIAKSRWESEYLLFKIGYDGYNGERSLPKAIFSWDIPVKMILKPEESVKAQKVSLGFEFNF